MTAKTSALLADYTEQAKHLGFIEGEQDKRFADIAKVDFRFVRDKLVARIESLERQAHRK